MMKIIVVMIKFHKMKIKQFKTANNQKVINNLNKHKQINLILIMSIMIVL